MYGHHIYRSMDQSDKVVNPTCGQLNRKTCFPFACSRLRNGLARQVRLFHLASAFSSSTFRLDLVLTH